MELDFEQIENELGIELFLFSDETVIFLYKNNINFYQLINFTYLDLRWREGFSEKICDEIILRLEENGHYNIEKCQLSLNEQKMYNLGYHDIIFPKGINLVFIRNNIRFEQLLKMTYQDLFKLKQLGETKIKKILNILNSNSLSHKIIIPPAKTEIAKIKEIKKEELVKELLELVIKNSSLNFKNKIDKKIFSEYKKTIKKLSLKKIEQSITEIKKYI